MVLIAQIALGVISAVAQAAEPTGTLTLACEGTARDATSAVKPPQPISMGIIVNFTARTVNGLSGELIRTKPMNDLGADGAPQA